MPLALAIAAVVRRRDGRYLLIRRAASRPGAGYWTPVTGRPNPGESLEGAVVREVKEEVGLAVRVGAEIHRCPAEGAPFLLVWFAAEPADERAADRLTPRADEVADARWVSARDALALRPMFTATAAFFRARLEPA
jgi:8-oxo-dGTP pyrophosphatase MutT (NUDIX family)